MSPILFTLPGNEAFGAQLRQYLHCDAGDLQVRRFPDGESGVRFFTPVAGRDVVLVAALDRPDGKIMPLYLAASVARELGARSVGLIIPYLPYMRQDAQFKEGEGIAAIHFARLISSCCDWFVTVDPHLHRFHDLSGFYTAKSRVVHSAPAIANWIAGHVEQPVIFGSDAESEQWVAAIAAEAACPYAILNKTRGSDREVVVSVPDASFWVGMTPVLVDDIVSTARTMIAAAAQIEAVGMAPPVCIALHSLFAEDAYAALQAASIDRIVSCNTVAHATNAINLCRPVAAAIGELLRQ